jgi:hypothetical protein
MNNTDWSGWILAICSIGGVLVTVIVVLLKSIFVTRGELKEAIEAITKVGDSRHTENVGRFLGQDTVLGEIKTSVAHIEGQLDEMSGKRPRMRQ